MPNHRLKEVREGKDQITTTNAQMQGLSEGGGRSGQSVFSQLRDRQGSHLPHLFPNLPTDLLLLPLKIPFTLLTPVFNL